MNADSSLFIRLYQPPDVSADCQKYSLIYYVMYQQDICVWKYSHSSRTTSVRRANVQPTNIQVQRSKVHLNLSEKSAFANMKKKMQIEQLGGVFC